MGSINVADTIVLIIILAVIALIIRGMRKGTIKTCDCGPGGCNGNCSGCGHVCATPRIQLTDEQLAQLKEIDARGKDSK